MFIAGTDSVDHELLLAEGISQTVGHASPVDAPESNKQCTILLLPLFKGILQPFAVSFLTINLINIYKRSFWYLLDLVASIDGFLGNFFDGFMAQ